MILSELGNQQTAKKFFSIFSSCFFAKNEINIEKY